MEDLLRELDKWLGPGSVVTILSSYTLEERQNLLQRGGGIKEGLQNVTLQHIVCNTVQKRPLKAALNEPYDSVIVLSNDIERRSSLADARSAVCSLLVTDLVNSKQNEKPTTVVAEIKDRMSAQVLQVAKVNDFVIANELTSMTMAELADNPEMSHILIDNILHVERTNLDILDAKTYFQDIPKRHAQGQDGKDSQGTQDKKGEGQNQGKKGERQQSFQFWEKDTVVTVGQEGGKTKVSVSKGDEQGEGQSFNFWELTRSARDKGHIAIGYKRAEDRTWTLNPKSKDTAVVFQPEDKIAILRYRSNQRMGKYKRGRHTRY